MINSIINFVTQHVILSISLIIAIFGYAAFELFMWLSGGSIEHQCKVSLTQLVMLFNHNNALIIDLRSADSYKAGHIIDSVNIPEHEFNSQHKLLKSHAGRPVVLVCEYGRNSAQLAVNMRKNNIQDVFFLAGGFMAWKTAGIPLVNSGHNKMLKNHNGKKIVIYTKDSCPYSVSAKNLLRSKGYHYKEIKVSVNSPEFNEMVQLSGGLRTIPQIFIDGKHIGGFDSLKSLDDKAEL